MADNLDFSFTMPAEGPRSTFRASLPGLTIKLPSGDMVPIKDISAGGIGFIAPGKDCVQGHVVELDLYVSGRLYLEKVHGHFVRVTADGLVACSFETLTRQQELRLDKLVLEMQKRIIALRKAKGEDV